MDRTTQTQPPPWASSTASAAPPSAEQLLAPRPLPRVRIGRLIAAILIVSMAIDFLFTWASSSSRSPTAVPAPTASSPSLPKTTPPPPEQDVPWGTPAPSPPGRADTPPEKRPEPGDQSKSSASLPPEILRGFSPGPYKNTAEIDLNNNQIRIQYLDGTSIEDVLGDLSVNLKHKPLLCERQGDKNLYDCILTQDNTNLAIFILRNGGARATADAPESYRKAEQEARRKHRGLWKFVTY